jgi:multicomponent Na+:H+ antiporter subunit F
VLLIALVAGITGRGDYLDVALVYAMINFIATVAVMRLFELDAVRREEKRP